MTAGPGGVAGPPGGPPANRPAAAAPAQAGVPAPGAPVAGGLASAFGAVLAAAAARIASGAGQAAPAPGPVSSGADGAPIPAAPGPAAPAASPLAGADPGAARIMPQAGADAPARAALAAYGALPFLAAKGRGIGGDASLRGAELLARLSASDGAARAVAALPQAPLPVPGQMPPAQPMPPYAPLLGPAAAPIDPARAPHGHGAPLADDEDVPAASGLVEIGLLRHFPTDWNAEGRLQGRTDVALSDASRTALRGLRLPPRWRDLPVLCSPLMRARETAEILGDAKSVQYDDRLIEMDFGDWEGGISADMVADPDCAYGPVEGWGWDFRPPNGESPAEMLARLAPVLEDAAAIGPCLIICHRGVMRAIMAAASHWPYLGPEPFRIRRARVHPVTLSAAGTPVALGAPDKLEPRA